MNFFTAVAILGAGKIPSSHSALIAFPQTFACYFHHIAGIENIYCQNISQFLFRRIYKPDFTAMAVKAIIRLGKMSLHGFCYMLGLRFGKSNLQCVVTIFGH